MSFASLHFFFLFSMTNFNTLIFFIIHNVYSKNHFHLLKCVLDGLFYLLQIIQILCCLMISSMGAILVSAPYSPHFKPAVSTVLMSEYPFVGAVCVSKAGSPRGRARISTTALSLTCCYTYVKIMHTQKWLKEHTTIHTISIYWISIVCQPLGE